jgi:hypothetical protein
MASSMASTWCFFPRRHYARSKQGERSEDALLAHSIWDDAAEMYAAFVTSLAETAAKRSASPEIIVVDSSSKGMIAGASLIPSAMVTV